MKVSVSKELALLYKRKSLNYEISVEWILGYIDEEFSRLISSQLGKELTSDYEILEIDDDIIKRIYRKFDSSIAIDGLFNFLCTIAFVLGGEE